MPDDHSIDREPHLQGVRPRADDSEARAQRTLERERRSTNAAPDSVSDEPGIFPGQDGMLIEQDWSCSRCGYNLRGVTTGHPCPECNHVEVYYPAPVAAESYSQWFRRMSASVAPVRRYATLAAAALLGGPFAVVGALLGTARVAATGPLVPFVIGPAVEEAVKIAALAWLIESRPYVLRSRTEILAIGMSSGLAFAVIENLLYLHVYIPNASGPLMAWRWVVCTLVHVCCTLVAAAGLVRVWQRVRHELRPPRLAPATPLLVTAIVIHAAYNVTATTLEWTGLLF